MPVSERTVLLANNTNRNQNPNNNLSLIFAIICIVDVFGVFPIVALPKPVIDCGFYGILVVFTVCSIQIYTSILLGKCWVVAEEISPNIYQKNRYPYAALAELTFGRTMANLVSFLLDITVFGAGIPNLIVASQNLQLLGLRISDGNFDMSSCYWIILLGAILCPILWLGSPKDMKILCSVSVSLVILVFFLTAGCLLFSQKQDIPQDLTEPFPESILWKRIFIAYGIIAFQFDIHPSILTIQIDMKEKTKLSLAIISGFLISLGMFTITSTIAAINFQETIQPSILETLPTTIPLHFAAIFVAVQLCLSSAVGNNAMYQHMEDCLEISRVFNQRRCLLRTTITLFAILIAESVPRFDVVMSLVGGALTAPLIFILPPLFYIKILYMKEIHLNHLANESYLSIIRNKENQTGSIAKYIENQFRQEFESKRFPWKIIEIICCLIIIFVSIICTIVTTYVNVKNVQEYSNFSQPCIYNVSRALLEL